MPSNNAGCYYEMQICCIETAPMRGAKLMGAIDKRNRNRQGMVPIPNGGWISSITATVPPTHGP
jgi:hypothetical protein